MSLLFSLSTSNDLEGMYSISLVSVLLHAVVVRGTIADITAIDVKEFNNLIFFYLFIIFTFYYKGFNYLLLYMIE